MAGPEHRVGRASPEARVAAGLARRAVQGVVTGGASVILELKLLAAGLVALLALILVLGAAQVMMGGEAQALTSAGVTPTCPDGTQAPPADLMPIYSAAADKYELGPDGWSVLAAINRIETGFGANTSNSSANAKGWMQFIDSTWAAYGVDADGDGKKNVQDRDDAIHGAANYLRASGAPGDWYKAIYAYNHADWYVQDVQAHAKQYRGECAITTYSSSKTIPGKRAKLLPDGTAAIPEDAPDSVKAIIAAANEIARKPYKWGGGHGSFKDNGYDCSGLVSYALHGAGLIDTPMTSWSYMKWGDKGPGRWVSIYASPDGVGHVFMIVAGLRLDTGGGARNGTFWHSSERTKDRSFSGFVVHHPPGL